MQPWVQGGQPVFPLKGRKGLGLAETLLKP